MGVKLNKIESNRKVISEKSLENILKKEIALFGPSFTSKKKEQMYAELSVLLSSGIRLKDALILMSETQKKNKDGERFKKFSEGIIKGLDFSSLLLDDKNFSFYEVHSIRIGEQTGTLATVVTSLGDFYARKNEQRRNIVSALTYPAIVLTTAVLAIVFMLRFVVPMFEDVFSQNQVELPALTKSVIAASEWMGTYGIYLLCVGFAIPLLQKFYGKNLEYRKVKDMALMRLPIFGSFIKLTQIARFTQAVSLLVSAKVSIPESIKLAKDMIDFYPLDKALEEVQKDILRGHSLSDSLKAHYIFDKKMIALIRVAEETNQTEFVFEKLNKQYGHEVLQKSKQLSTLLEPIIILLVGIIVATILIAMYLPMFELGNVMG